MNNPYIEVTLTVNDGKKEETVFGKKILFTEESFTKEKITDTMNHIRSMLLFQIFKKLEIK